MTNLGILITILSAFFFTAVVLFGAWIDGRRQKLLEAGKHPITTPSGDVMSRESQEHP